MIKILAIDDNRDNLVSLKAIIKDNFSDSQIFTALNGPDGIDLAYNENPDVILLDVLMPGMDGFEVCHRLKMEEDLKEIPVIFLTALKESRENRIKALESGAEAFLSKPIDETELIAQIRAMVKINEANKQKKSENERLNTLVEEKTLDLKLENEMRKKTESALRESEQRWSTTLASIGDAVIATEISQAITFMNPAAECLTGWDLKEALQKPYSTVFKIIDEETHLPVKDLLHKLFQGKKSDKEENYLLISKDGRQIPIDNTCSSIKSPQGKVTGAVLVFRDITQRRLAEEVQKNHGVFLEELVKKRTAELEIAKINAEAADRLKSAFLANLSHELRTPLNSIIGFSGVLLQGYPGPVNAEQKKQIGMIQSSGRHLLSLINDILDLSKIESGQLTIYYEFFDLFEVIDEVIRLQRPLALDKGLALNLSGEIHHREIESDKKRVQQILLNLVNNAIKFTEQGSVDIHCECNEEMIIIEISDTGIGIEEKNLGKLFNPFIQIENNLIRKNEGSGLGLSICKKLMELLEGEINVRSHFGTGSTFTIKIPLKRSHNILKKNETLIKK